MLSTGSLSHNTIEHEQVLTNTERDNILRSLFLDEGEVDSSFLYKWKWAELYAEISRDKSYPFIDIEVSCLRDLKYNQSFKKILEKTDFITDVWSWDWQKAVALLKWTSWKWTYIPEDYSREMLDIAEKKIREELPQVKLWSSQKLNNGEHLPQQCQNNMYLFLWWTICNMSDEKIINELKNMDNNWIISWNKILLSYFTAPKDQEEIDNLIKIYNSENNKAFHENGLDMLWLSRNDFEYDTVYEKDNPEQKEWPSPWRIKWIIRAKNTTTVTLSNWNKILIKKWEEFTIHYSRRFSKEWIEKLFKESGCNVEFTVDNAGDSITLLQKKPRKMWGIKKMASKAVIWAFIMGSLAGYGIKAKQVEKVKEKEKVYTERKTKAKAKINSEKTYYIQECNELISALQLDELDNEDDKQAVIDLFNKYVWDNKADWVTNMELIQWFWKEYGWILIEHFWVSHSPYDFMTPELINSTSNIEREMSEKNLDSEKIIESYDYDDVFEYNDSWNEYFILKVCIWTNKTPIYLAAKKWEKGKQRPIPMSTNNVKNIKNKTGLDQDVLLNNDNLEWNLITYNIDGFWHKRNTGPITLWEDCVDYTWKTYWIFLEWNRYYVKIGKAHSWVEIWLASDSPDWPFTTTMFNKIAKDFKSARLLY